MTEQHISKSLLAPHGLRWSPQCTCTSAADCKQSTRFHFSAAPFLVQVSPFLHIPPRVSFIQQHKQQGCEKQRCISIAKELSDTLLLDRQAHRTMGTDSVKRAFQSYFLMLKVLSSKMRIFEAGFFPNLPSFSSSSSPLLKLGGPNCPTLLWDHAPIPREVMSITQWLQVSGDMLVSLQNIFSFGRQNQISPWRRRRRMELLATRALPHLVQCLQAKSASSTNLASHS